VNYDKVAIYGYSGGGQGRHVYADPKRHGYHVTEDLSEHPRLEEARDGREGDREEAHGDVGDGQVCDEDVRDGLHGDGPDDDVDDEGVAGDSEQEDDAVESDEEYAGYDVMHDVIVVVRGVVRVDG